MSTMNTNGQFVKSNLEVVVGGKYIEFNQRPRTQTLPFVEQPVLCLRFILLTGLSLTKSRMECTLA